MTEHAQNRNTQTASKDALQPERKHCSSSSGTWDLGPGTWDLHQESQEFHRLKERQRVCVCSQPPVTHTRLPAVVIPSTLHHCCTFCSTIAAPLMVSAVEKQTLDSSLLK